MNLYENSKRICGFLVGTINPTTSKKNVTQLIDKIKSERCCTLWTLSKDLNEYNRYHRMLDGSLKNIVDTSKLNVSLLANSSHYFKEQDYAVILHDPSDIRKPHSEKLEGLGKVKSLEGKTINGFRTFNSAGVDLSSSGVRLLSSRPYSTGDEAFVGIQERKDYEQGQIKDSVRREQITQHLKAGSAYHLKDILFEQVKQINKSIQSSNSKAVRVHVLDREFDDKEVFNFFDRQEDLFVIRGKTNRNSDEWHLTEEGKEVPIKLTKQVFFEGFEQHYQKIGFKKKLYQDAKGVFEYGKVTIDEKSYSVVRVKFYQRNGRKIFKQPMLLISNLDVDTDELCSLVFELYMKRSKIEAVFKFCKDVLGWESPRVDDFECFKNILSLVYFIAGYFYEVEPELVHHPQAIFLAQLGNGKGKVTPYYILRGLQKVAEYHQIKQQMEENQITDEQIQDTLKLFAFG